MLPKSRKPDGRKASTTVSRRLGETGFVELVFDPEAEVTALAVHQEGVTSMHASFMLPTGEELAPVPATNNLIKHRVVLLPETPEEYSSTEHLIAEIQEYICRYVDLSEPFLGIASYYILLTWVYDAFNELPYLRVRGDYGCGKTRALLILGSICYKPFFASGASTVSPIFHTIDTFRGTLIFDEADFRFSDEKAELVKIFNNGNVRGFPVLRTAMTPKREFDPVAFAVFGPKVVGMRDAFQDPALESRFITEEMGQRPVRRDIPINLPDAQQDEALALRNKLLLYRFRMLGSTGIDARLASTALSHRLNQILIPLLSIIPDETVQRDIQQAAAALEHNLQTDRSATPEAQLLEVLAESLESAAAEKVAIADIAQAFVQRFGTEYERPITNRYVGSLLRRKLRVFTYKSHGTFFVPTAELAKLSVVAKRYGVDLSPREGKADDPARGRGDMGTVARD